MLMRFGDSPDQSLPPGIAKDKVMHAAIRIGDTVLLASDGNSLGKTQFQGVSLSFTVDSAAQADKVFAALADGGKVTMPIATTFFAKRFGQVTDRFGLSWMILLPA
jgi:PhnB protein